MLIADYHCHLLMPLFFRHADLHYFIIAIHFIAYAITFSRIITPPPLIHIRLRIICHYCCFRHCRRLMSFRYRRLVHMLIMCIARKEAMERYCAPFIYATTPLRHYYAIIIIIAFAAIIFFAIFRCH